MSALQTLEHLGRDVVRRPHGHHLAHGPRRAQNSRVAEIRELNVAGPDSNALEHDPQK